MTPLVVTGLCCLALLLASALFSALQTALFSLDPLRLRDLRENRPKLARRLEPLLESPRHLLGVLLLADTLVNLPLVLLGYAILREGAPGPRTPSLVAALLLFGVIVILCDLLPKLVGLSRPLRIATLGLPLLSALARALGPLSRRLEEISERIATSITPRSATPRRFLRGEELGTLFEVGAERGTLAPEESEILAGILKLGDRTAKDCMTPRVDMVALPEDADPEDAAALLRRYHFVRLPVFRDTPDQIIGVLDARRFLLGSRSVHEALAQPVFVPATMRATDLLRQFLSTGNPFAVVVDEFGGTEGIATVSDLLDDLLAEAFPTGAEPPEILALEGGKFLVSGHARLDELGEKMGLALEAEGIDTIGGLVFHRLGQVPRSGTRADLPPVRVEIRRSSRRRIEELQVEPLPAEADR